MPEVRRAWSRTLSGLNVDYVDNVWICRNAKRSSRFFPIHSSFRFRPRSVCRAMSVLDDFARMRLYRERASEFELLAETEPHSKARLGYRIVARHYRELADREEQSDKARVAEHLKMLKLQRREAAE